MLGELLDTDPRQQARYYELLRALSTEQRGQILVGLCTGVRAAAEAGIRQAHPGASDDEVKVRLTVRLYGVEVARRLHGPVPDDAR